MNSILYALGVLMMSAGLESQPGDYALVVTSSVDGSSQPYRLFIPEESEHVKPLPLAVVLHGRGVDQDAWFDFTPVKKYAEEYGYVVVAPNGRGIRYYEEPGEHDVLDIIAEVKERVDIDENRVYLMGHSMGGFGTWYIAGHHPDIFASIAPMAGIAVPSYFPNYSHLSPFIIHSDDDPIVQVKQSRFAASQLALAGISFQYREEHGYGHASSMIGDNLPRIFEWFNAHPRVTCPKRVSYFLKAGQSGNAYWIDIPKSSPWYPAAVGLNAVVSDENRIEVDVEHIDVFRIDFVSAPCSRKQVTISVEGSEVQLSNPEGWVTLRRDSSTGTWSVEKTQEAESD